MSTLRICRICLRTEAKGYKFEQYQLKYFYEEVTAQKIPDNDELPQWFCYECATLLHKFHEFKEKCYSGLKCMREMLRKGPITYEAMYKLERDTKHLKSPLERFILTDRVKLFTFKDKALENTIILKNTDLETKFHIKIENNIQISDAATSEFAHSNDSAENISEAENINDLHEKSYTGVQNINLHEDHLKGVQNINLHEDHHIGVQNINLHDDHYIGVQNINLHEDHYIGVQKNEENHNTDNGNLDSKEIIQNSIKMCDEDGNINIMYGDYETSETVNILGNTSPVTILFVQEDKIIIPKHNDFNNTKTKNVEISDFGKFLNENNWKKIIMSENEALEEFRKKAEDSKYLDAAFKCTGCFKGFSNKDMLYRHVQSKHSEGAHECRICRMRFKWPCNLRKHIQQHYTKYECLLCHVCFNLDSSALVHQECHSGATRACGHCGEQFRHVTTYYTHMRTHRSGHVCVTCGASFVSENGLLLHTKRIHSQETTDSLSDDDDIREIYCPRCDIQFRSHRAFTEHLFHSDMHSEVIKEEESCQIEESNTSTPPKKIMGKRQREEITKEVEIQKCETEVLPPVKVKRRRKKIKKYHVKPSTCYQCGEEFPSQTAYYTHHIEMHPGTSFHAPNQRHICELCGASLAPGSVALHNNLHTRQVVYECDICRREFYSKISLTRHFRTHTGEKPFQCPLCEKRFTQSNSMKLHYRTFHLKQPYPKRNKNKKSRTKSTEQDTSVESDSAQQEPTDAAAPEARPTRDTHLQSHMGFRDENIHYFS